MTLLRQAKWIAVAAVVVFTAGTDASRSWADNPALWTISAGTNGEDVFLTAPTAVDLGFPRYVTSFEFTRVEAFVQFFGGVDVTDNLENTSGTAVSDSLPVTLIDEMLADPMSGTSANVNIGIDATGFGQVAITDVELGSILGFNIERIEVDANLSVAGLVPGDFDGNLVVDAIDLGLWESAYGMSAAADTNFDGATSGLDFLDWQQFLGADYTSLGAAAAIPEPQGCFLALIAVMLCARRVTR